MVEVGHLRHIPAVDVLIELLCLAEHPRHVRYLCGIPVANGLIEGIRLAKHTGHIPDPGHIPTADGLVEAPRAVEHAIHVHHAVHIPVADRLVEGICTVEHQRHRAHIRNVPAADVLIEEAVALKEIIQVGGHQADALPAQVCATVIALLQKRFVHGLHPALSVVQRKAVAGGVLIADHTAAGIDIGIARIQLSLKRDRGQYQDPDRCTLFDD